LLFQSQVHNEESYIAAMSLQEKRLCLFGASPETGNQGVNALCWSTIESMARRVPADFRVFSYGASETQSNVPGSSPPVSFRLQGISAGRRLWRADHLRQAEYAARVGWTRNTIVREVRNADLVLDVSGGDSFTDLYGPSRFKDIIGPKNLALALGTHLVLLPQTYGPFASRRNQRLARDLVAGSALAYARDRDSYDRLQSILGPSFDPERHRLGVDVAFGLQARRPSTLKPALRRALSDRTRPLIGLNISGLLANRPAEARQRFSLASDYGRMVKELVSRLLQTTDAHILLVPHVHAPLGHYESDLDACLKILEALPDRLRATVSERITVITEPYDATELKWIIGQTEWFCGSRMHSTIAALSSGVAACALAYSLKTRGVFASCGIADAAVDLRQLKAGDAIDQALWTWQNRQSISATLATELPRVKEICQRQFDEIAGILTMAEAA
jgi:polysaccharide pyruvyl transferase WcaK-like protein